MLIRDFETSTKVLNPLKTLMKNKMAFDKHVGKSQRMGISM